MLNNSFEVHREYLLHQFENPQWLEDSGLAPERLREELEGIAASGKSRLMIRAEAIACILRKARLSLDARSEFGGIIDHQDWMLQLRDRWRNELDAAEMKEIADRHREPMAGKNYDGNADFGHISPDWERLISGGFPGLLADVRKWRAVNEEGEETRGFYAACELVASAILDYLLRVAEAAERANMPAIAQRFRALAEHAPDSLMQAYQMLDLMYILFTFVEGENLRSMGRVDHLLGGLYDADVAAGLSAETMAENTKQFLARLSSYQFCANAAITLCGVKSDGGDATNALSNHIIDVYATMNIYDPKMQIRLADSTPRELIRKVINCIRSGMNSFVFINDSVAIAALRRMGFSEEEARNYLLIGCYEPSVCGKELPCTCNGIINFAKLVEVTMNDGCDPATGIQVGPRTGEPEELTSFEDFMEAYRRQYRAFAESVMEIINNYEKYYYKLNPAPVLSLCFEDCVRRGCDVYEGGAKYNNSSINSIGIGTAADSLAAIRKFVYEDKLLTLDRFAEILRENWQGEELLRRRCIAQAPKYGNGDDTVDAIAVELAALAAETINGRKNGRGGIYRAGLFSINWNIEFGEKTGATPDGRLAGEPFSMNLGASVGCDRQGVTALMRSVSGIDFSRIPNGCVLDLMLHPSVTAGPEGMQAMEGILETHCALGCFAVHMNIFSAEQLKAAQREPEKYASLQVRVCGWNAYFVNLSEVEQQQFILRAEALEA